MKRLFVYLVFAVTVVPATPSAGAANQDSKPAVDVVFVLDTTGSMSGLIEGARVKIWSIANRIVGGTPAPDLRVGLVGYRDVGDEYVTRVHDLSADLDAVYGHLTAFDAAGGGDTPEHVSRALHDAVHGVSWSPGERTLRIVFLVGDAPPQTGYDDGFDYRRACEAAVRRDIVVNTIQCGAAGETARYWREIAALGGGGYAAVPQSGGMRAVSTPFDGELSRLGRELSATVVVYGDAGDRARVAEAEELADAMPAPAAAERAAFKSVSGRMGSYDLLDALEAGTVDLDALEGGALPEEMRAMDAAEKRAFVRAKREKRADLQDRIAELTRRREVFIRDRLEENGATDAFDERVLSIIREQAERRGIVY